MPGNVSGPNPTDVMPAGLCSAFTEEIRMECWANTYQDGNSERMCLVTNARRFFRMTRNLTPAQYTSLYNFYKAHLTQAFYFYNVFETANFSTDNTGGSTVGRYTVVFDGGWSDQTAMGRSQGSLGLREVQ